MKCMSCEAEIPSEWKAAIANNMCPKCGGVIMDSGTKDLFDELYNVMKKLEAAPEGVMNLLLSSYNLRKMSAADLQGTLPENLKHASNPVQEWLKRTDAPHLVRRDNTSLRAIMNRINEQNQENVSRETDPSDTTYFDSPYEEVPATAKEALHNNVLVSGGPPPSPKEIAEIQNALGDNVQEYVDPNLHPALQKDRMKRLAQSRGIAQGGGQGNFRRSG